jgi:hypothetical protein
MKQDAVLVEAVIHEVLNKRTGHDMLHSALLDLHSLLEQYSLTAKLMGKAAKFESAVAARFKPRSDK